MITIEGLTKTYGDFRALDDVSFGAAAGRVTGFLGPNGAGKTTCLRILTGLADADHGGGTIGGHRYADLPNPGRHVGVLLDASAQHAGRTGREVLTLGARTMGLPDTRVEEMLTLVGLSAAESKRRVGHYSLGMRQRLGLAHALLGSPSVLILDEPANGLDPAGIHWMRGLFRNFAAQGGTVLLSSHLLHEVEMIADDMVVIGRGRIVAQGAKQDLLSGGGSVVRAEDLAALETALRDAGIAYDAAGDGSLRAEVEPVEIGRAAAAAGVVLTELRVADGARLEELFLQLTAPDQRDSTTPEGAQA